MLLMLYIYSDLAPTICCFTFAIGHVKPEFHNLFSVYVGTTTNPMVLNAHLADG